MQQGTGGGGGWPQLRLEEGAVGRQKGGVQVQTPTLEGGGQPGSRGPRAQMLMEMAALRRGRPGCLGDRAEGTPFCLFLIVQPGK